MTRISWHVKMAAGARPDESRVRGREVADWRRRRPDEPRARGRESASAEQWQIICAEVRRRAEWCCEACGRRGRLDVHHVVKRSQGGFDFDRNQLVALCRACHARTGRPVGEGTAGDQAARTAALCLTW